MLLFSTILDIDKKMKEDDFIRLVIEWNQNNTYEENVIQGIQWNGERNVRYGDKGLSLAIEEYRSERIIAVRYEKREDNGVIWDTDYVMNFKQSKMTVRLDRSYTPDALDRKSEFSTPYFINYLIDRGYLKDDHKLPIKKEPIVIDEKKKELIDNVINKKVTYNLPIVYVSKTNDDKYPVDVEELSYKLKGVAHVMIEEGKSTDETTEEQGDDTNEVQCDDTNENKGAIDIYYPLQGSEPRRFFYKGDVENNSALLKKVVESVIKYSNAQMVDALFTWQGVNNALLRDKLNSQKKNRDKAEESLKAAQEELKKLQDSQNEEEARIREKAIEDANAQSKEYIDAFTEDFKKLEEQVKELTNVNESLLSENQGLKTKLDSQDAVPVLYMGAEDDFYPGEIKDLILSSLIEVANGIESKSRRADVVRDIIENNNYQKLSDTKADTVKSILRNYDGMSKKTRQTLEELGFEITEDGKHYKVTYYGDGRYQISFSKTPSDVRTGKNCAQQTINTVF
ncbi:MAG: hypothetical protein K5644_09580 [Lachnospiraceae bacterium]|nr:hypothetical protein [Lachnospiraceae bacterium]